MRTTYKWAPSSYSMIHRNAHTQVLKRGFHRQTHLTKLFHHDNLPTNLRVHRADKRRQMCRACGVSKEDRDHVLQCTGETRVTKREEMLQLFGTQRDQYHTDLQLKRLLLDSIIERWMGADDCTNYRQDPAAYPLEFARVIYRQNFKGAGDRFLADDIANNAGPNSKKPITQGWKQISGQNKWTKQMTGRINGYLVL